MRQNPEAMRGFRQRRTATLAFVAAMAATVAQADALTIKAETKAGGKCEITTIAQPSTYGLSVPDCPIPVKRVTGAGYLYREPTGGTTTNPNLPIPLPLPELPQLPLPIDPLAPILPIFTNQSRLADSTRFEPSSSLPYNPTATTDEIGIKVHTEFAIQLRSPRKHPQKWKKSSGGSDCVVTIVRRSGDTLLCSTLEPVG
jgi:hypothetical protein